MSRIFADMPIPERIGIIEEALEKVLDRGPKMFVDPGDQYGQMFVWVVEPTYDNDIRIGFSLYEIARELEVLLS